MDSIQPIPAVNLDQAAFDKQYITAHQIAEEIGISRSSVTYAQRRGVLPAPHVTIPLGNSGNVLHLWARERIAEILERWIAANAFRKGAVSSVS